MTRVDALKCPACPSRTVHWTGMAGGPDGIRDDWRCLLCLHEFTTERTPHRSERPEDQE